MPYSSFTLKRAAKQFGLTLYEEHGTFAALPSASVSTLFQTVLAENLPLAVAMNTEKARSELLVTNVLLELRRLCDQKISLFSGIELDVNRDENLNGFCDFLVSLQTGQLYLSAPVIAVVGAKNDNLPAGLGQCVAEMVGAQRFNDMEGNTIASVYSAVTSGTDWMFARLTQDSVTLDLQEDNLSQPLQVLGILYAMIQQRA